MERERVFNPGDRVVCVEKQYGLTEGREYVIKSVDIDNIHYRVVNDHGNTNGYYAKRFRKVDQHELIEIIEELYNAVPKEHSSRVIEFANSIGVSCSEKTETRIVFG